MTHCSLRTKGLLLCLSHPTSISSSNRQRHTWLLLSQKHFPAARYFSQPSAPLSPLPSIFWPLILSAPLLPSQAASLCSTDPLPQGRCLLSSLPPPSVPPPPCPLQLFSGQSANGGRRAFLRPAGGAWSRAGGPEARVPQEESPAPEHFPALSLVTQAASSVQSMASGNPCLPCPQFRGWENAQDAKVHLGTLSLS